MDLKGKHALVTKKMDCLDYESLWPRFHQYRFALYDNDNVFLNGKLFPKTNEFIGNTSINYQGDIIGIWHLAEDMDADILTSKLVHETFHAFQKENGESRYPNEIEALVTYQYVSGNLSLKMAENRLIASLVECFNETRFKHMLKIRKFRKKLFPYETKYETAIEQIEGTAGYVELMALKQLNQEKYIKKLSQMKQNITDVNCLLPVRIACYDVGALLIAVLVHNGHSVNYEFNELSYLHYYLDSVPCEDIDITESPEIINQIDAYNKTTQTYIDKSVKRENLVLEGEYDLIALNVYNARFLNNYLITTYFLMYKDIIPKVINGNYVVKINEHLKITEVYNLIK